MAEIFVARGPGRQGVEQDLVVKRILPHLADNPRFVQMFIDEATIASHLKHRNVVEVFDFGEVDGQWYLAMEYVRGLDAWRLLRRLSRTKDRIPPALCIRIAREMLAGLDWVHGAKDPQGVPLNIVHRDVSPSNLYCSDGGDVKLGDFGIARARLSGAAADGGTLKGKYGYMAPEQILGRSFDHRADLFSAGVVLAELLLGHALFTGNSKLSVLLAVRDVNLEPIKKKADELPPGLLDVLLQALAREPENRFASARDFAEALHHVLATNDLDPAAGAIAGLVKLGVHGARRRPDAPPPVTSTVHYPQQALLALGPSADEGEVTPLVGPVSHGVAALATETPSELFLVRDGEVRRGPMRYADLVELLTTGEVGPDTQVSRNGGPERRLTEEPDLARHLPMRASVPPEPAAARGSVGAAEARATTQFEGSFDRTSPVAIFCEFATSRATGLLVVQSGPVVKEVYLVDGRPQHVMSNLAGEMLGEFLVGRKVITRGELDMALAILPRYDGKLGDTLASLGLLEPLQLLRHITEQVKAKLLDLFRWRRGTYRFQRGVPPPAGGFPLGIDPFDLIVEGVSFGYPNHEVFDMRPAWEGRTITPTASYGPGFFTLPLPPSWSAVLEAAGTPGTLREILDRCKAPDAAEALRAIFLGLEAGLLQLG
jgi:serine/threonine-protein kinase